MKKTVVSVVLLLLVAATVVAAVLTLSVAPTDKTLSPDVVGVSDGELSLMDSTPGEPSSLSETEVLAELDYDLLPEASGLGVSGLDAQRLWFINDSGNRSELIALDLDSRSYSRVNVLDTPNRDWEDMEVFDYRGTSWIVIADVGDNDAERDKVFLYFLPEPSASKSKVRVRVKVTLSYPDGPRDVESVAVDPHTETLYLLSKREPFPKLYALPLPALDTQTKTKAEPELLGEVRSIPVPSAEDIAIPVYGKFRSRPTGMAHMPNGSGLVLLTYNASFYAELGADRNWLRALNDALCRLPRPDLKQAESIAADREGRVYVTSEGRDAPLLRLTPPAECRGSADGR